MSGLLVNQHSETMQQESELTLGALSPISGGSVVLNKPTVVYSNSQVKLPVQKLAKTIRVPSPGVITTIPKNTTVVYPTANKGSRDVQKTVSSNPQTHSNVIPTARLISQKCSTFAIQQQPPSLNSSLTSAVGQSVGNSIQASKFQVTFDACQMVSKHQSQQPSITSTTIISSGNQQKLITTTSVKTITSVTNINRIPAKSSPGNNIQKVKAVSTGINNQAIIGKNIVSRIQVTKTQASSNVVQPIPATINQVMTNALMQRVQQPNVQKYQTINQKQVNQGTVHTGSNLNLSKAQQAVNIVQQQVQISPKVVGSSQKTLAVQRQQQQQQQPQPQQQQQQQQQTTNNIQKISVAGIQKVPIQNQQLANNSISVHAQQSPRLQNKNPLTVGQVGKTAGNNSINCMQANMTKLPITVTVNKTPTVAQTHQVTVQQISPQVLQSQSQVTQKQQTVPLQTVRIQGSPNIQPKQNANQQTLTNFPINQKNLAVMSGKIQPHQQQMLLRIGTGKNSTGNLQTNVKPVSQKSTNMVKNSQAGMQQSQMVQRNINMPVKIIQQSSSNNSIPGNLTKQAGCIKTIPPQKSQQKNIPQSKTSGIKTSLNTNINNLKTLAVAGATVTTLSPKSNVKALHPQQQQNISTLMAHKNQQIKLQSQNMQQTQILVSPPFAQQVRTQSAGQIKTILPLSISPEIRKDIEKKIESKLDQTPVTTIKEHGVPMETDENSENKAAESSQQSPAKKKLLPYECLQFVLQDHNYGAPPPRTPPPTSPPPKPQPVNGASGSILPHQTFIFNQGITSNINAADDAASAISSEAGREVEPEGEETETAPEGEGDDEDSITRCICDFEHDDGYMICCDRCLVWQHVDCMGIDRSNIPDEYLCEICRPRRIDRQRARTLQMRKREELMNSDTSSDTSSTSSADTDIGANNPAPPTTVQKKRPGPQQQQQHSQPQPQQSQQIPRRKSDPTPHRRLNNNNSNNSNNNNNSINESSGNTINNNNYSNTINKNPRQTGSSTARRKETAAKRGAAPGKRRNKRRLSLNNEEESQDAWGSNMAPLRQWIERYEEAVTNHYSPELRARISSIKVNGAHSEFKQSNNNMSAMASGKCRVNVHSNNLKFLVATVFLPPNTPVVELRGKYMLSTQHRSSHQGRQHAQRPGPFVFFHRLLREGTEVCVDTRTYGNDARFVRRSCTPNAEVKHCIEKGTLHLYIVTTQAIDKNAEITIRHEEHDLMSPNNSNSNAALPLACACGNPRTCQSATIVIGQVGSSRRTSNTANGNLVENPDGRERRRRGRKVTVTEEANPSPAGPSTAISIKTNNIDSAPNTPVVLPDTAETTGVTPRRTRDEIRDKSKEDKNIEPQIAQSPPTLIEASSPVINNSSTIATTLAATISLTATVTTTSTISTRTTTPTPTSTSTTTETTTSVGAVVMPSASLEPNKKDKKKMTREERKMEAIMKAFERLEKAEQRKQEVQARNAQRKESGSVHSDNDDRSNHGINSITQPTKNHEIKKQQHTDRPIRRKRRKGRARTTSSSSSQQQSSSRRTRLNSADSDISSNDDDGISMQSPPIRRRLQSQSQTNLLASSSTQNQAFNRNTHISPLKDDIGPSSGGVIPTAAGLLLALANSNVTSAGSGGNSPPSHPPAPSKSPTCDSGASSSSQSSTPSTPLSSACLLVAAAVGPLAPGFKFPKTKKVLMNEWLRESPDLPQVNPYHTSVPTTSTHSPNFTQSQMTSGCILGDQPPPDYLSQQNYAAKGLATLVQAVNSVSGICDSPPQRKQTNAPLSNSGQGQVSSGSAKKRWLRQAISEECDSPNSRPDSPPSETVAAPPKKRRIARESLSSDNYTPPTTPTLLLPDSSLANINTTDSTIYSSVDNDFIDKSGQTSISCLTTSQTQLSSSLTEVQMDQTNLDMKKTEFYRNFDLINCHRVSENLTDVKDEINPQVKCKKEHQEDNIIEENRDEEVKNNLNDDFSSSVKMEIDSIKSESIEHVEKPVIKSLKNEPTDTYEDNLHDREICLKTEPKYAMHDLVPKSSSSSSDFLSMPSNILKISQNDDNEFDDLENLQKTIPATIESIAEICCKRPEYDNNSMSESEPGSFNDREKEEPIDSVAISKTSKLDEMSIDEFDVEAQMKKITGDDGNDCIYPKEKVGISHEKDKSYDGIEALMESSKDDSGSGDKEIIEAAKTMETNVKNIQKNSNQVEEERAFKEIETMSNMNMEVFIKGASTYIIEDKKSAVINLTSICSSSEESMFDSASNIDCESMTEPPPEVFQSIPPLSERIRKKTDSSSAPKKQLDFETAIIESTIDMDSIEVSNGEHNTASLSTALRHLMNTKTDDNSSDLLSTELESLPINKPSPEEVISFPPPSSNPPCVLPPPLQSQSQSQSQSQPQPQTQLQSQSQSQPQLEVKRLKDPRKAIPHERTVPDASPTIKRKLSITEYRKRKQQSFGTPSEAEPSNDTSSPGKSPGRGRSDSASSGTSSLSSDEDSAKAVVDTPDPLTTLPLFQNTETDERKSGEDGTIGWSSAPTLVERQRENLTERLKREFGLFLSDDEEERARKQGLTAEAIFKVRMAASSPQPGILSTSGVAYLPTQLPPQPYIPPPGSATVYYPQFPENSLSTQVYQNLTTPQQPIYSTQTALQPTAVLSEIPEQTSQFLVPQAPPGSNPYPPQFASITSAPVNATRFSSTTPPPTGTVAPMQTQNPYYSHPHPPPRT